MFFGLVRDVQVVIVKDFLTFSDFLVFSKVCKQSRALCNLTEIWKGHALKKYPILSGTEVTRDSEEQFFWKYICFYHKDKNLRVFENLRQPAFFSQTLAFCRLLEEHDLHVASKNSLATALAHLRSSNFKSLSGIGDAQMSTDYAFSENILNQIRSLIELIGPQLDVGPRQLEGILLYLNGMQHAKLAESREKICLFIRSSEIFEHKV